jgi:uncharacterized repeat protein (TIGR02543 family)
VRYTITFDSHGGSAVQAVTADEGTAVPKPADPTRTGYAFQGWFSAAEGGTACTWPYTLNASVTMHARWLSDADRKAADDFKNTGTVKEVLKKKAGEIGLDTPAEELEDLAAKVDEVLAAYEALPEAAKEALAPEKAQLEAVKEKIENVRTAHEFQDTYGNVLGQNPDEVNSPEDAPTLLPELEDALAELGALPEGVQELLTEDKERLESLKEKVEKIIAGNTGGELTTNYTLSFDSHGGSAVAAITAGEGKTVEKPVDPTRNGYTFQGWYSAAEGGSLCSWPHTLTAGVTVHARWQADSYTITYNLNGGTNGANPASYTVESSITLTAPGRTDYAFGGWYDNENCTGTAVTTISAGSTGNKTFWAKWTVSTTSQGITLTIDDFAGGAVTEGAFTLTKPGGTKTVSITGSDNNDADAVWYIGLVPMGTGSIITLYADTLSLGTHTLRVTAEFDGVRYSKEIALTVED